MLHLLAHIIYPYCVPVTMSSRKAGGSRGHSSQQYRRSSVTQSELEAISSEQPETGAGRISPFAQSAQYNLCFFPGDSSLAVGDATLGLGSQLSSSDGGSRILVPGNTALQHQKWQPSFTFDRKSDRPSTSFQFEDATSGPNFGNTSSSTSHQLHPEIPPDNTRYVTCFLCSSTFIPSLPDYKVPSTSMLRPIL